MLTVVYIVNGNRNGQISRKAGPLIILKTDAMKKLLTILSVLILIWIPSSALEPVAEGKTNHELGYYIIEKSIAPLIVDARILPTYEVSYENSDMTIRIAVDDSDKKCRKLIVVSDHLSIQYNCDGKIFGVNLIEDQYTDDGISNSKIFLDSEEYFRQKVISQSARNEINQIKLISVYFPKLVKDYERVFAVK